MQDIALSTFLVIQHELHGDARAARPARVGRIAAVTGEIARIFREIRWRHASSYTSSAMPCLAGERDRGVHVRRTLFRPKLGASDQSRWELCVVFATLQDSFDPATLRDKFSVPMLRGYYSKVGVSHEVSGHQALHRGFWPPNER